MNFPTVTLEVSVRKESQRDRLGNYVVAYADPTAVEGCLIAPGSPSDLGDDRPESAHIAATAHFPRGFNLDLKGAVVSYNGKAFKVVGSPIAFPDSVQSPWLTYALLERDEG